MRHAGRLAQPGVGACADRCHRGHDALARYYHFHSLHPEVVGGFGAVQDLAHFELVVVGHERFERGQGDVVQSPVPAAKVLGGSNWDDAPPPLWKSYWWQPLLHRPLSCLLAG